MFLLMYFAVLSIAMLFMIMDFSRNKQKIELQPIIITTYIIQCIGILGGFINNSLLKYNFLSLEIIFEILGFCIFVEVAFIFILIQYLKFNKNKGV